MGWFNGLTGVTAIIVVTAMVVASVILVSSTALFFFYLLATVRRILHRASMGSKTHAPKVKGVTMKRIFSSGMGAFNHLLHPQGHSQSVARLAAQTARQMGLPGPLIEDIRLGGTLHDIGMIYVPEALLKKPSPLTPKEFEVLKRHTVLGRQALHEPWASDYLRMLVRNSPDIQAAIRNHHEAFDGSGYPDHLRGKSIPLAARIVAVANAFDNMVTDLPYRRGRSVEEAVAELRRCSGTQFDPDIVEAFVRSLELPGDSRPPHGLDKPVIN